MPTTGHTATSPSVGKVGTKKAVTANAHRLGQTDILMQRARQTSSHLLRHKKDLLKQEKNCEKYFWSKLAKNLLILGLTRFATVTLWSNLVRSSHLHYQTVLSLSLSLSLTHTHTIFFYSLSLSLSLSLCLANIIL